MVKWTYYSGASIQTSPAIADLDNDGELEIVIGSAREERDEKGTRYWYYYCINSDGSLKWKYETGGIGSSPAIADLDNDGELEIVILAYYHSEYGAYYDAISCIGPDGTLEWMYSYPKGCVNDDYSPAIADLDNDGELEIVISAGLVYVFDSPGPSTPSSPQSSPSSSPSGPSRSFFSSSYLLFLLLPVGMGLALAAIKMKRPPKLEPAAKPLSAKKGKKPKMVGEPLLKQKPTTEPKKEKSFSPSIPSQPSISFWSRLKEKFHSKPFLRKSLILGAELLVTIAAGPLASHLVEVASKAVKVTERYSNLTEYLDREDVREAIEEFIKGSVEDIELRSEIREAIKEALREDPSIAPDIETALSQIKYDLSSVLSTESEVMTFLNKLGSEVDSVLSTLIGIEQLVSYYYTPSSKEEVLSPWGLPSHLDDALTMSERLTSIVDKACSLLKKGENVVLVGEPGTGKTTLLYAVWKRLWNQGRNVALLREGAPVGRHHEDRGFFLFFDDIPEAPELADMVYRAGSKGIVTTARTSEWSRLKPRIRDAFTALEVPRMSDDEVRNVLINHLERLSISYSKEAVEEVVSRAEGLPVYAWTVVRDLQIKKRPLTLESARKMPRAMLDYVEQVIASTLLQDGRALPGAYCCLASLYCLSAMRGRRAHADHLHEIHRFASAIMRQEVGDRPDPGLFASIRTYLVRDPELMAYKLPHDSWADILEGKGSGPVSVYIDDIRNILTEEERRNLLKSSFLRAWDRALSDYQKDPSGNIDRALGLAYLGHINFKIQLAGLKEMVDEFRDRKLSLVLRNLMRSL